MMLRSSSTPVLGSLLCSFSESPNHYHHHHHHHHQSESQTTSKHSPITTTHQNHNKLSFPQTGSQNFTPYSFNSSPISPAISEPQSSFRRAQSEGNLLGLVNSSPSNNDEFNCSNPPKKFSRKPNCSILQTIPSFSFHNSKRYEDDDSDEEEEREELGDNGGFSDNPIRGRDSVCGELNLENKKMGFDGNFRFLYGFENVGFEEKRVEVSSEMYLARGLGVDGVSVGFGGGGGPNGGVGVGGGGGGGGDRPGVEEHYKRMVEENPGNPLFLRNYAQYLYQSKQDFHGAEEYYSRAILADPKDGEILSQYAKLVWELHRDEDRATSYFERAVHAAPEDSHVQAAYASFLWEIEEDEDEDEDNAFDGANDVKPFFHKEAIASATA